MLLIHFMALISFYNHLPPPTPPLPFLKIENQSFCNVCGVKKEISDISDMK